MKLSDRLTRCSFCFCPLSVRLGAAPLQLAAFLILSAEEILLGEMLQSTQLLSLLLLSQILFLSPLVSSELAPFSSFSHQDVLQLAASGS